MIFIAKNHAWGKFLLCISPGWTMYVSENSKNVIILGKLLLQNTRQYKIRNENTKQRVWPQVSFNVLDYCILQEAVAGLPTLARQKTHKMEIRKTIEKVQKTKVQVQLKYNTKYSTLKENIEYDNY